MIHHREQHSVQLLLPDHSLDSFFTGDKEGFLDICIDELSLISTRQEHVSELCHPLVPLPSICADPLNPQGQTVRDVVCTVGRMTGAREQVLASIRLFPVEIGIDEAITDTERCVEEGDRVLGGAGAAVRVRVALLLGVLNSELDGVIDGVDLLEEAVQLFVGPEPDPIAVPINCRNNSPSNSKMLYLRTRSSSSKMKLSGTDLSLRVSRAFLTASTASSLWMLE